MAKAGFLAQDLPSEDESDEDYNPLKDKTNPELAEQRRLLKQGLLDEGVPVVAEGDEEEELNPLSRAAKRRALAAEVFEKLQQAATKRGAGVGTVGRMYREVLMERAADKPALDFGDDAWKLPLGLSQRKRRQPLVDPKALSVCAPKEQRASLGEHTTDSDAATAGPSAGPNDALPARAALHPRLADAKRCAVTPELLAAARVAPGRVPLAMSVTRHREVNKVTVQEERKFAGETVMIEKRVDRESKEAVKAAGPAPAPLTPLQKLVRSLKKGNKVSIVDKTKADWEKWKAQQGQHIQEELETYKKSGTKYLDRQDFLKRAELREYEIQRDARLASDVRTRGRL